jgi:hypothetical protein
MMTFAGGNPIDPGMLTGAFYLSNMLQAEFMSDHAIACPISKG